jgi:hypothetical protein
MVTTPIIAAIMAAALASCVMEAPTGDAYGDPPVAHDSTELAAQDQLASSDTENEVEAVRPPPFEDCQAHVNGCLQTRLADAPGNQPGERRCASCLRFCQGQGLWPMRISSPSGGWMTCQWWNY